MSDTITITSDVIRSVSVTSNLASGVSVVSNIVASNTHTSDVAPSGPAGADGADGIVQGIVAASDMLVVDSTDPALPSIDVVPSSFTGIPESAITDLVSDLAGKLDATAVAGGDLTGNYPDPTLVATGTAGTYGDASHSLAITTDSKGRVTAVTSNSIQIAESQVTNLTTDLAAKATDSLVVHLAGTETITGAKTFNAGKLLDKGEIVFDVKAYGAVGDGSTNDATAIGSAITAAIAAGGGTVFFPAATYKITSGLTIDPATLTSPLRVSGFGAKLDYTGSGDAITISTNIASSDVQHAERTVYIEGLHITGTGSATSAIRNKATMTTLRHLVIENFTNVTGNVAAIIQDGSFHFWVEQCHFDTIDIKNTGYGILFLGQDESAGTATSIANNKYTNIHIWVNVAAGKGIWGKGLGVGGLVQIARSVFDTIVVHTLQNNIVAYDLRNCYAAGTVFIAPSVDVFGSPTGLTGFYYTYASAGDTLTLIGPTIFPSSGVATWYDGGGAYNVLGGNLGSTFITDVSGNTTVQSLTNLGATATTVPYLDGSKKIQSSAVTPTELGYLSGVTSAIQTQLNAKVTGPASATAGNLVSFSGTTGKLVQDSGISGPTLSAQITDLYANKQPLDADLTTIAGLTATTDNFIVSVASAWASRTPAQVRTTLGLVIGTNVQAWDADLDSWASVTRASGFDTFVATPSSANLRSLITDETGTGGSLVFSTSPTLTTPKIATTINDANGNALIGQTATASAVNYLTVQNGAASGTGIWLYPGGTDTDINLTFAGKGAGVISLQGNLSVYDGMTMALGTSTGTKFGTGTTQKIGFYGVTPVVQPASASQAAAPAGGTGATAGAYDTAAHRDSMIALVNAMRTVLVNVGLMKGSA